MQEYIKQEIDPNGLKPSDAGAKLDQGKNRIGLVVLAFARALTEVSKVGTYGSIKYSDNGWIQVVNGIPRYTDAMFRHLFKEAAGEVYDKDTELLHAAHTAWNALARLDLMIREKEAQEKNLGTPSVEPAKEVTSLMSQVYPFYDSPARLVEGSLGHTLSANSVMGCMG